MRIRLRRNFESPGPSDPSLFGLIETEGFQAISCEREWHDNQPNLSCVPAGFYYLEPHNGSRYRGTFALIGDQISHVSEPGVQRSACVLHSASSGTQLQGCISAGGSLVVTPTGARLEGSLVRELIELLRARPDGERHYLMISEAYPISTVPARTVAAW